MRQEIATAPRDGTVVILEDDASGSYDVAYWSPEAGAWVGRYGKPSKITPTHWYSMSRDQYHAPEDHPSKVGPSAPRRRFSHVVDVIAAAALIIGVLFYVTRYTGQRDTVRNSEQVVAQSTQLPSQNSKTALPAPWQIKPNLTSVQAEAQKAAQVQQPAVTSVAQPRQSLNEERDKALARELTEARRAIERLDLQLQAEVAKSEQSLIQEWQQTTALAQEAAVAQQALDEERARSAALASKLEIAQREIETQATQLRESLQQERDRTAAMGRDPETARHTVGARVMPKPVTSGQISTPAQAEEADAIAQPAAAEAQSSLEATRLIARASALLRHGDISAAQTVLERAAETGSAQATFLLAQTYDPDILSAWGAYGTRGEVTRARQLYANAHASGIQEAEYRFNALRE